MLRIKTLILLKNKFYIFKKVFRNEEEGQVKIFDLEGPNIIILDSENRIIKTIENLDLPSKTVKIFEKIKNSEETTFPIMEAEEVMSALLCTKIKAGSLHKADIEAEIYDRISESIIPLGFSVKSMAGSASTLLNAGKTTNFIFQIEGLDIQYLDEINKIDTPSKTRDKIKIMTQKGGTLKFKSVAKKELETNLRIVDTVLPEFIAQMLIDFFSGKATKVSDLVKLLSENSSLNEKYGLSSPAYEFKIKSFLQAVALGMVPSKIWDGFTKAHGGYIIVKEDGIVVCYHLYNRDDFLLYLYENTKFESSSTSKHEYGNLYVEDDKILFNLNLQIRFLK